MAVWSFFAGNNPQQGHVTEYKTECEGRGKRLVQTQGEWKLEPGYLHIVWDPLLPNGRGHLWDKFTRPIRPSVRGDNWTGVSDCVIADKIGTPTTLWPPRS